MIQKILSVPVCTLILAAVLSERVAAAIAPPDIFPIRYSPLIDEIDDFVVADLNSDGRADLAAVMFSEYSSAIYFYDSGSSEFVFTELLPFGSRPEHIVADDFDLDGDIDLVVTGQQFQAAFYRNSGDGTFGPPESIAIPTGSVFELLVFDYNKDGYTDLIIKYRFSSTIITYMLGNGDGTFQAAISPFVMNVGNSVSDYFTDLDGDGRLDILRPGTASGRIHVAYGNDSGEFDPDITYAITPNSFDSDGPAELITLDLTGDGLQDILVFAEYTSELKVLTNRGNRVFELTSSLPCPSPPYGFRGFDADADGDMDVLAYIAEHRKAVVFINDGQGNFIELRTYAVNINQGLAGLGDINGDGLPELLLGAGDRGLAIYHSGDAFDESVTITASALTNITIYDTWAGDLGSNGHADVLIATGSNGSVEHISFSSEGLPIVNAPIITGVGDPSYIALADFDADNSLDIAVLHRSMRSLDVYIADSQGGFVHSNGFAIPFDSRPTDIAAADLNCDESSDIVVGLENGNIEILINDGLGVFTKYDVLSSGIKVVEIILQDINDDSQNDIIAAYDNATS